MKFILFVILCIAISWLQLRPLFKKRNFKDVAVYFFLMVMLLYAGIEYLLPFFSFRAVNIMDYLFKPIGIWIENTLR